MKHDFSCEESTNSGEHVMSTSQLSLLLHILSEVFNQFLLSYLANSVKQILSFEAKSPK